MNYLFPVENDPIFCRNPYSELGVWSDQGLLKLLRTVYSEEKLQLSLKLRKFQNPLDKDKTVGLW